MGYAVDDSHGDDLAGWWFPAGIAVAAAWRGRDLGRYINALLIDHVVQNFGARLIHESVDRTIYASQAMLRGCSLSRHEEHLAVGLFASALPNSWRLWPILSRNSEGRQGGHALHRYGTRRSDCPIVTSAGIRK
jgi:hypothetical protein